LCGESSGLEIEQQRAVREADGNGDLKMWGLRVCLYAGDSIEFRSAS
jgi:hypothetical protein